MERKNINSDVYQKVFELTLNWGDQWGERVKDRIAQLYPGISREEIEKITTECREIHKHSLELRKQHPKSKISTKEFKSKIQSQYPHLNDQNTRKLFYYSHPKIELKKKNEKQSGASKKSAFSKIIKKFF